LTVTKPNRERQWIKAGIEFFNGAPRLSIVACETWIDWSVSDLPAAAVADAHAGRKPVTFTFEKAHSSKPGAYPSMKFYYVDGDTKVVLREISWIFAEDGDVDVAAFVARDEIGTESLTADFSDFNVTWK
jgi:regulation of enolase protein 1 (concanavalin A-like superfamily)